MIAVSLQYYVIAYKQSLYDYRALSRDSETLPMAPKLTVAGDVRWETIDAATAERLGLETRTLGEPARRTGSVHARAVKVEDLWIETPIDRDWLACYRLVTADDGTLQVGELRVLPQDPVVTRPGTWSGTWHGLHATPPAKPLTSRHVHALRVVFVR